MALRISLILISTFLIGSNIVGLFIPFRNPEIYHEKRNLYFDDITLNYEQVLKIASINEKTDELYIEKVNNAVNKGIAHYWRDEGIEKYHLRVPFYENYILYFASFVYPNIYRKYEYCDYKKNLKRGVGLCSTHALVLFGILEENNIAVKIVRLSKHVVTMVQIDKKNNTWYVIDPDVGVIVKNSMSEINENPEIINSFYNSDFRVNQYSGDYEILNGIVEYKGRIVYFIEIMSNIGIWLFPIILFFTAYFLRSRHQFQ